MKITMVLAALIFVVGCKSPSMNVQRSSLRAVGDVAATVTLENVDASKVEATRAEALNLVAEIETFLSDGSVPNMAVTAIRDFINSKVPAQYSVISDTLLRYLPTAKVPTDKIGADNLKRILAACAGLRLGLTKYDINDRLQ